MPESQPYEARIRFSSNPIYSQEEVVQHILEVVQEAFGTDRTAVLQEASVALLLETYTPE